MVKGACKETLQEAFIEAIQVEKDIFFLNENHDFPKTIATNSNPFNMSNMNKLLQKMSNEMVDLNKNSNENQTNNICKATFQET